MRDVRASFWAVYPFDQPDLAQYRKRLDQGVTALLPRLTAKNGSIVDGVYVSTTDMAGTVEEVAVQPNSTLFPDHLKEKFPHTVLAYTSLQIDFYKTPIDPAVLSDVTAPKPDLTMSFETTLLQKTILRCCTSRKQRRFRYGVRTSSPIQSTGIAPGKLSQCSIYQARS